MPSGATRSACRDGVELPGQAARELEAGLRELRDPRRHVGVGEHERGRAQAAGAQQRDVQRIAGEADVRIGLVAFLGGHETEPLPVRFRPLHVGDRQRELLEPAEARGFAGPEAAAANACAPRAGGWICPAASMLASLNTSSPSRRSRISMPRRSIASSSSLRSGSTKASSGDCGELAAVQADREPPVGDHGVRIREGLAGRDLREARAARRTRATRAGPARTRSPRGSARSRRPLRACADRVRDEAARGSPPAPRRR